VRPLRVLLTGGTGFIGSHLVERLQGHEVFSLARRPPSPGSAGVSWIQQDLTEPLDTRRLPGQIDVVMHLAQSRHYKDFPERAGDIFAVNVNATLQLLDYSRNAGATRFIFASTGGVYRTSYEKLAETAPISPLGFYLSSKYAAELLISNYQGLLETVVVRPFFVYGPGQKGMLIPTLATKVVEAEELQIQGNPGLRINPIFVDDAVRVFERLLEHPASGVFNVAGSESVSMTELVHLIGRLAGREPRVTHVDNETQGDLVGDTSKMNQILGIRPETGLRDGLSALIESITASSR
jgi:UDP-glucose 4-epimerase